MVLIPAKCMNPACGLNFQPNTIEMDGVMDARFINAGTICPDCGSPAKFIEGRMNVRDGGIELLSGPQWSVDLIDELRLALVRAEGLLGEGVAEKVVERRLHEDIDAVAPGLSKRLRRPSHESVATWVGAIAGVLALVQTQLATDGATSKQIEQIYRDIISTQTEADEPDPAPTDSAPIRGPLRPR